MNKLQLLLSYFNNFGSLPDLRGANLQGADLRGAYLQEADLQEADLRGADLQEADLRDTGVIVIVGLTWLIIKYPTDMQIGCERHNYEDWRGFTKKDIESMDSKAWEFWSEYKSFLVGVG